MVSVLPIRPTADEDAVGPAPSLECSTGGFGCHRHRVVHHGHLATAVHYLLSVGHRRQRCDPATNVGRRDPRPPRRSDRSSKIVEVVRPPLGRQLFLFDRRESGVVVPIRIHQQGPLTRNREPLNDRRTRSARHDSHRRTVRSIPRGNRITNEVCRPKRCGGFPVGSRDADDTSAPRSGKELVLVHSCGARIGRPRQARAELGVRFSIARRTSAVLINALCQSLPRLSRHTGDGDLRAMVQ